MIYDIIFSNIYAIVMFGVVIYMSGILYEWRRMAALVLGMIAGTFTRSV